MKKLLIIGLLFAGSLQLQALSNAKQSKLQIGQLCGDDGCDCGKEKERPQVA